METVLRLSAVKERTGLSRSMIYAQMYTGRFPKQKRLGKRAVGWLSSDVEAWVKNLDVSASKEPETGK
jgi:prophage regulatory protein